MSYLVTQMLFCLILAFLLGLLLGWWIWARGLRTRIESVEAQWRSRLDQAKADLAGHGSAPAPRTGAAAAGTQEGPEGDAAAERLRAEAGEARVLIARLEKELADRTGRVTDLEGRLSASEEAAGQLAALEKELAGVRGRADEADAGAARLKQELATGQGRLSELEAALEVAREEARKARLALSDAEAAKRPDDLTRIEGIGPVIARLLGAGGIASFEALRNADPARLKEILLRAGERYRAHDPGTWPEQAALAAEGRWEELEALQDLLIGGRRIDDLTRIEGIGPQIHELLRAVDIITFEKLADAPVDRLRAILEAAGERFRIHDPETWPEQARLAADGRWEALDRLQDELKGGRRE